MAGAKTEKVARDRVILALQQSGYSILDSEPKLRNEVRADVVAWAADGTGELVPWLAVEIETLRGGVRGTDEVDLAVLEATRASLGTREHYVFDGQQWREASEGMRTLTPVAGPRRAPRTGSAHLSDPDRILTAVRALAWQGADATRGSTADPYRASVNVLLERLRAGTLPFAGQEIAVDPHDLAAAVLRVVRELALRRHGADDYTTPVSLVDLMARMLGPLHANSLVLDPFAGVGGGLLAVHEEAARQGLRVHAVGVELNVDTARVAEMLADLSGYSSEITVGDAFACNLAKADYLVSVPPFGLRLSSPHQTMAGPTTDGDIAVIDLVVGSLRPGGRAVLLTSQAWTARAGLFERLRERLAREYRVAALVSLPRILQTATNPLLLSVIDATEPTETFVAQLGEDWSAQLSDGAAMWEALSQHLGVARVAGGGQ